MVNSNSADENPNGMVHRVQAWVGAWQPLTGRGAAAFADASPFRAIVFHLAMVVVCCGTASWTLSQTWVPAISRAVDKLPESAAEIRAGHFRWPDRESVVLGETPQFGVAVNPTGRISSGQVADLQIEFGPTELRFCSLTGYLGFPYPRDLIVGLDRVAGRAGWDAWFWAIATITLTAFFAAIAGIGWFGASVAALPAWLIGLLANRSLSLSGAWRLVLVCWIPGALLLNLGMWGYSRNWLHLVGLAGCSIGHFLVWMAWVLWAIIERPERPERPQRVAKEPPNPFRASAL